MDKIAVLLMAYGAAGSLDEIEAYLNDIRGGRPLSPGLVDEIKRRYQLMGGKSPLLKITRQQAAGLETAINRDSDRFRVYIGMRHWHPYIKDTVADIARDGFGRIVAICLTPYYSKLSVGAYFQKLDEAIAATGKAFNVHRVESWNDQPKLIEVITEKINTALDRFPVDTRPKVPLLFTAHSLPERILTEKDPYPEEFRETIELVMKRLGPYTWRLAYQSRGRTPEPWLGPDAAAAIDELAGQGHRNLLMAPIGFISDHMETLYDVDVMYQDQCKSKGIRLERAGSLNTTPLLIETLVDVVQSSLPH